MVDAIEATSKTSENLPGDVDDILKYIQALNYGLGRLKDFPLCLRLIEEVHKELMETHAHLILLIQVISANLKTGLAGLHWLYPPRCT